RSPNGQEYAMPTTTLEMGFATRRHSTAKYALLIVLVATMLGAIAAVTYSFHSHSATQPRKDVSSRVAHIPEVRPAAGLSEPAPDPSEMRWAPLTSDGQ